MAMKQAFSARLSFTLNKGVNPSSGAMLKETISISKIEPNADENILDTVAKSIASLFANSVVMTSVIETFKIL